MTSIESLPNELLIRIFSHLKPYELTRVDQVSQRWNAVISEYVWNQLTSITKETIGNVSENCFENFIAITHRVRQVKEFITGLRQYFPRQPEIERKLRSAIVELANRRTPDAIFSLPMVQDILALDHLTEKQSGHRHVLSEARPVLARVLEECKFDQFEGLRVDRVSVHKVRSRSDPFLVIYKGRTVQLVLDVSSIKRLYIGCLKVQLSAVNLAMSMAARNWISRLSFFPRLETVEVDSLQLVAPSLPGMVCLMTIILGFRPGGGQFGVSEFISLLHVLERKTDMVRNQSVLKLIDRWKTDDRVLNGEISLHSSAFYRLEPFLQASENALSSKDGITAILCSVFSSFISKLTLLVSTKYAKESRFVALLLQCMPTRLRELSLHYTEPVGIEENLTRNVFLGMHRTTKLFDIFVKDLTQLDKLSFNFRYDGAFRLTCIFPTRSKSSPGVPQSRELIYESHPCFLSLIRIVTRASKLRHFEFSTSLFEDELGCLEWVETLLQVLDTKSMLRVVTIKVAKEPEHVRFLRVIRQEAPYRKSNGDVSARLAAIEQLIDFLPSHLPLLQKLSVTIETSDAVLRRDVALAV